MEELTNSERLEIEDYQKNAIQLYSPIDLSKSESEEDAENFEAKDNYVLMLESFKQNRVFLDSSCRNALTQISDKDFSPYDLVTYKTKDYRVVNCQNEIALIRNSKRLMAIHVDEITHKIRDLTPDNLSHIYDVMSNRIDMTTYNDVSFLISLSDLLEIDVVKMMECLPEKNKERIKAKLKIMREA